MDLLHGLIDLVLHLDRHLVELVMRYDMWIYAIVCFVVFAETGFVVTPFLPGDSLLFALGALAAIDATHTLNAGLLAVLLTVAAVLGNTVNYHIGRRIGQLAFSGRYRFINVSYLRQTEDYFTRHGAATMVLSRFAPIIRTFAPFVAGVGRMPYATYQGFNVLGAVLWVNLLLWAGYLFGNIPVVKSNFGLVTLGIIVVSMLPMVILLLKQRRAISAGQ
jgi:membrane-associated protein